MGKARHWWILYGWLQHCKAFHLQGPGVMHCFVITCVLDLLWNDKIHHQQIFWTFQTGKKDSKTFCHLWFLGQLVVELKQFMYIYKTATRRRHTFFVCSQKAWGLSGSRAFYKSAQSASSEGVQLQIKTLKHVGLLTGNVEDSMIHRGQHTIILSL